MPHLNSNPVAPRRRLHPGFRLLPFCHKNRRSIKVWREEANGILPTSTTEKPPFSSNPFSPNLQQDPSVTPRVTVARHDTSVSDAFQSFSSWIPSYWEQTEVVPSPTSDWGRHWKRLSDLGRLSLPAGFSFLLEGCWISRLPPRPRRTQTTSCSFSKFSKEKIFSSRDDDSDFLLETMTATTATSPTPWKRPILLLNSTYAFPPLNRSSVSSRLLHPSPPYRLNVRPDVRRRSPMSERLLPSAVFRTYP